MACFFFLSFLALLSFSFFLNSACLLGHMIGESNDDSMFYWSETVSGVVFVKIISEGKTSLTLIIQHFVVRFTVMLLLEDVQSRFKIRESNSLNIPFPKFLSWMQVLNFNVQSVDNGGRETFERDIYGFLFMDSYLLIWNDTVSCIRCGYDQIPGASYHPLDGVLGLGKGKSSIVTQLHNRGLIRNVVGHCLSGRGGGFLFFGNDVYDTSSPIVWTPMSTDYP